MSTSQPAKQSERANSGGRSSSGGDGSSTEGSSSESSTRTPPREQAQGNPPPPKIPSFIGKDVVVPTTQDSVHAILPTSGAQFEIFTNLVKEKLVSQDEHLNIAPQKETPQEA